MLTIELRRRSAAWVRRYTIEQCALVAERAALLHDDNGRVVSKAEMARRATRVASEIRSLGRGP